MKTNDSFSFSRLIKMIKLEIAENYRILGLQILTMAAITYLLMFLSSYSCSEFYEQDYFDGNYSPSGHDPQWTILTGLAVILGVAFAALSASQMATDMSTKAKRLITLMTPATQLEKFIARWIIYSPGYLLIFAIVFLIGDLTRVASLTAMFPQCSWIKPFACSLLVNTSSIKGFFTGIIFIFAILSTYTLGSYLWPRRPFTITTVVTGLFVVTFAWILMQYADSVYSYSYTYPRANECWWLPGLIMLIWSIASLVLAYWRFKDDEIVKRW